MSDPITVQPGPARWFPEMPPALPGEDDDAYTNRLTGAAGTPPYDHRRYRQCSIGLHDECSDPAGSRCQCPCHTALGKAELRLHKCEESLVALWAVAAGRLEHPASGIPLDAYRQRIVDGAAADAEKAMKSRPELADWYLRPAAEGDTALLPIEHLSRLASKPLPRVARP